MKVRRGSAVTLVACLAAAAAPSVALAGTAKVAFSTALDRGDQPVTIATLTYRAAAGERNRVSVSLSGSTLTIADAAGATPGDGCSRPAPADPTRVSCGLRDASGVKLRMALGDRDDTATMQSVLPSDESVPSGDIVISGGPGRDLLDGGPGYGTLAGDAGADRLRGGTGGFEFSGGPGDDRLTGGQGSDSFDEGPTPSGRDTISGGAGGDVVDYGRRRTGVRADLAGDRDDGAPGERDRIGSDVEGMRGGSGADRLIGSARRNGIAGGRGSDLIAGRGGHDDLSGGPGGDMVSGGAGPDTIDGDAGGDVLDGGPGRDFVRGLAGPDRIYTRDGGRDEVECGGGRDSLRADRFDYFSNRFGEPCEFVLRSAPPIGVSLDEGSIEVHGTRAVALPIVGCPGDKPGRCHGRLRLSVGGRAIGSASFSVLRDGFARISVNIDREVWQRTLRGERVDVVLRIAARDARGTVVVRSYRTRLT